MIFLIVLLGGLRDLVWVIAVCASSLRVLIAFAGDRTVGLSPLHGDIAVLPLLDVHIMDGQTSEGGIRAGGLLCHSDMCVSARRFQVGLCVARGVGAKR
jgi:hypothetical protein